MMARTGTGEALGQMGKVGGILMGCMGQKEPIAERIAICDNLVKV